MDFYGIRMGICERIAPTLPMPEPYECQGRLSKHASALIN